MTSHKSTYRFTRGVLSLAVATAIAGVATPSVAQQDFALEEIVVTAQKRAESVDDVPITINAFAADGIREMGAQNVNDMGTFIPGVETNVGDTSQASFTIRGISTNDFGSGSDPAVAVYVDGVYTGHGGSALVNFNDIDRVEVLKGPQGTLFGRNAAAGAISITTKAPSQETEGYVDVQMGNYNKQKIAMGFSTGLSDTVAFRVGGYTNKRDGFINNASDTGIAGDSLWTEDDHGVVASLLWQPGENTDVILRGDYNKEDTDGPIGSSFTLAPDNIYDDYTTDNAGFNDRTIQGASLTITHGWDDFTLTSITAQRGYEFHQNEEEDGTDNARFFLTTDTIEDQSQFSQEFRLNFENEDIKWFVGASYFKDKIDQTYLVDATTITLDTFFLVDAFGAVFENPAAYVAANPQLTGGGMQGFLTTGIAPMLNAQLAPFGLSMQAVDIGNATVSNLNAANGGTPWQEAMHNSRELTSYAVYGDVTYSITDTIDATLGLRWSKDEKDFAIQSSYTNLIQIPTLTVNALNTSLPTSAIPGAPQAIPFGLIFFEQIGTPGNPELKNDAWSSVDPRLVVNYRPTDDMMIFGSLAKGYKAGGFNSLGDDPSFDNEDVINGEVGMKSKFMDGRMRLNASYYYFEYDNLQILKLSGPAGVIPTYNIKNADAKGQGVELEWQFLATENLMLAANYGWTTTEYTRYEQFDGDEPGFTLVGEPLSSMPENKFNAMAEYTFNFANDLAFRIRGDYNYTGDRVNNSGVGAGQEIEGFQVVNLRATLENAAGDWSLALYANNLFDEEYLWDIGGTGDGIGSPVATRGLPRMYGLQARYNF
ncbi:TonB-dependent receptor [Simiduia agarivorans]|uniref:TonB-dependent receptor, plug n=1 Tax=Simiduia agarivorans (strain DSM 21679 / JCM 13881 / BCRC 17597 / SA1) TaxID=1117647 RepID=K4KJ27_SIMAS|nr:TonB-dependent receptor [Simiduia agarivorans]AFU99046.1 TonB-dependent receptor, plug [Simiduia agarivorans SA1 = DSM 21679]